MVDTEMLDRVRILRATGVPPKVIARALGLPPASVTPLIKAVAAECAGDAAEADLVGCWVSPGWSHELAVQGHPGWPDAARGADPDTSGMVGVVTARAGRHGRVNVCAFLVDTFCLGVKNTLGPRSMDEGRELVDFTRAYFDVFDEAPLRAPLELAQHLVFGAVDYARGLGFEPHPDFAAVAPHLGRWAGPSDITFGCEGKPFYVEGPYDDAAKVIKTLRRTVGEDGFHFIAQMRAFA